HDGQYLLSASLDKTLRLWSVAKRSEVKVYDAENHQVQAVRFAPDDKTFATGGADGFAPILGTPSGKVLQRLQGHTGKVNDVAFDPSGKALLTGGSDKTWILWDLPTARPVRKAQGHNSQIKAVDFSPDGKAFATGSEDTSVRVWEY